MITKTKVDVQKILNSGQPEDLHSTDCGVIKLVFRDSDSLKLSLLYKIPSQSEESEDEVEHVSRAKHVRSTEETIVSFSF